MSFSLIEAVEEFSNEHGLKKSSRGEGYVIGFLSLVRLIEQYCAIEEQNDKLKKDLKLSQRVHYASELDNTKLRTKVEANIPVERISGLDLKIEEKLSHKELLKVAQFGSEIRHPSIEDHNALKAEVAELKKWIDAVGDKVDDTSSELMSHINPLEDVILKLEAKVAELEKRPDLEKISMGGFSDFPLMGLKEILQHIFKNIEHTK